MKPILLIFLLATGMVTCQPDASSVQVEEFEKNFIHPPAEAGPETWWHWINGNVTREGITRDLEDLKDKGYRGVTAFSIGHGLYYDYEKGDVPFMSREWYDLFHHAVAEADRLGLKLQFHNCDGWATSGGPWVEPEDAMKEVVFSEMRVKGPATINELLPKPSVTGDLYKEIAVIACPATEQEVPFMQEKRAMARSDRANRDLQYMFDDNPTSYGILSELSDTGEVSIILTFREPVSVSKIFLSHTKVIGEPIAIECELFAGDENGSYRSLMVFIHRQPASQYEFGETRAEEFKLVFHSLGRRGKHVFQQPLKIRELQLLPADREPMLPLISDWESKAGYSNFKPDGNWLPQEVVDAGLIIPAGQQIDLTDQFSDGTLQWEAPPGEWKVIRLGYTITGKTNEPSTREGRGLECDKLSAGSVESFFRGFPEKVLQENSRYPGNPIQTMLVDSWEAGNQNWTGDFPEEFRRRRGYSITPWLLVLSGRIVESVEASERFLWDFRRTIGDLIAENYYGKMAELTHKHGIELQAEAAFPVLQFMTDAITYHSKSDIPMSEFWVDWDRIGYNLAPAFTDAASAAHIYDKKIVACESFTCAEGNWRHSPSWLKPAADKVFCIGVNRITFDTYTHQPDERLPGWNLAPWGVVHNRKVTWWDYEKPWIEYLSRCQYLLQMGDHVADFLLFTGEGVPSTLPVQAGSGNGLIPPGYAFDGCNRETLLERIMVKDGKLVLPHGPEYRAIILHETDLMTAELAEGLARLIKKGATVFGTKPLASPGLKGYTDNDAALHKAADMVWGKGGAVSGMGADEMVDHLDLNPDFEYRVSKGTARLEYIHKREGKMEIYFISNQDPSAVKVVCTFRVNRMRPELWLPDQGKIEKAPVFLVKDQRIEVPLQLDPYGSMFVVFRQSLDMNQAETTGNRPGVVNSAREVVDSILLTGPWQVRFPDGMGAPEQVVFNELTSWTADENSGIKYYSGTAIYHKYFHIPDHFFPDQNSIFLQLGDVREIARISINGKEAGILWKPPYETDITEYLSPGENRLEVHVVNTWTNRLIGDQLLPQNERYTWVNCCLPLTKESALMKSGLLGPVKLTTFR
ncbi:MAG: glycosyl hydrolase [Bacteroidota bacterium]